MQWVDGGRKRKVIDGEVLDGEELPSIGEALTRQLSIFILHPLPARSLCREHVDMGSCRKAMDELEVGW